MPTEVFRVPYIELEAALLRGVEHLGLTGERAALCARLFAETTRDGVYTHGLNRLPRLAATVRNGSVDVHAEPTRVSGAAAIERWDGHRGVGNLNAWAMMARTMELAREFGIGAVALGNSNHWMRGGTYGWRAAEEGMFAMCWSNTLANLPPWGAKTPALGNTPLVLAVPNVPRGTLVEPLQAEGQPHSEGQTQVEGQTHAGGHVVVDMAMSQFSYGSLASYAARGVPLPVPGGFDTAGNLTTDAAAIEASQRALPVGYWKGSGLSLVLDMFAAMLSGGLATHQLPRDPLRESGTSQFFLAIDPARVAAPDEMARMAEGILASIREATPVDPARPVRYPGEQTLALREENLRLGVPVEPKVWEWLLKREF